MTQTLVDRHRLWSRLNHAVANHERPLPTPVAVVSRAGSSGRVPSTGSAVPSTVRQ